MKKIALVLSFIILSFCACTPADHPPETSPSHHAEGISGIDALHPDGSFEERLNAAFSAGETALLWEIRGSALPEKKAAVYSYADLSIDALWPQIKDRLFPDAVTVSDKTVNEDSEHVICLENAGQTFEVHFLNGRFYITGLPVEALADYAKSISAIVGEATNLAVSEIAPDEEEGIFHRYAFMVDSIPLDPIDYTLGSDKAISPVVEVTSSDIYVSLPILLGEQKDTFQLEDCLTMRELQILCEVQWKTTQLPLLCVLDDIELIYLRNEQTDELFPAWCLRGRFYEINSTGYTNTMEFLINAITGEIIQFL